MALSAVAIDLDGTLGDTRPLWGDFLSDAARGYASIAPLDPSALPENRGDAAEELDRWAEKGVGDWRAALERFAEERAPVHFRPSADAAAALRALAASGRRLGVYTDAPAELAAVALAHLGAGRHVELVETGAGARERLLAALGPNTAVAATREDLVRISESGGEESR
jgi:phosphoglycolate phosphatase-like HAD superfamily hydrolase